MEENNNSFNIELDDKTAEGVYANLALVNHSNSEFVLDFVSIMPGVPKARVKSRVIMSPIHVRALIQTLNDNLQRFERETFSEPSNDVPFNFGPTGQA